MERIHSSSSFSSSSNDSSSSIPVSSFLRPLNGITADLGTVGLLPGTSLSAIKVYSPARDAKTLNNASTAWDVGT